MKTKILKLAAFALLLAGTMLACGNETDDSIKLQGTTWKLVGFADVETGTLRKAVPEDCLPCYTITFITDTTFTGKASSNLIHGHYKIDYEMSHMQIICGTMTEVVPYFDEELFVETMNLVQSFALQEDEMRLYYNDRKNYLLFKLKTT
ncbi:MAG: META domain-containing protein [Dysgonamonadaceae bacterium]|jgi:hypothetical protein|nr:META domain-containing protein [Dysgonamonadaceae bacterium]